MVDTDTSSGEFLIEKLCAIFKYWKEINIDQSLF